jgi:hypothetical protein
MPCPYQGAVSRRFIPRFRTACLIYARTHWSHSKKYRTINSHEFSHRIVSTHSRTVECSRDIVSTVSDTPSPVEKNVEKEEQPRPKIGVFAGKRPFSGAYRRCGTIPLSLPNAAHILNIMLSAFNPGSVSLLHPH